MSTKIILALTVLMSFGIYDVIQGEIIYGMDIPRVDGTAISGKWFLVASTQKLERNHCNTIDVTPGSDGNFTMDIGTKPKKDANNTTAEVLPRNITFNTSMKAESNIIFTSFHGSPGPSMVFFDVVNNSYKAIYTKAGNNITYDAPGAFVIFSRFVTLCDDILEEVKKTSFYKQAPKAGSELYSVDATDCE